MTTYTYDSAEIYLNGARIPACYVSVDTGSGEETRVVAATFGEPSTFTCEVNLEMAKEEHERFLKELESVARAALSPNYSTELRRALRRYRGKHWRKLRKTFKRALGWHGRWTAEGKARDIGTLWDWWPEFMAEQWIER